MKRWKIRLRIDSALADGALLVMTAAQKCFSFSRFELTARRLAVHEAISNALKYGGGKAVLTAFGNEEKMRVEISQKCKIVWPDQMSSFQGVALIRRYARKTEISDNSRTLILWFY